MSTRYVRQMQTQTQAVALSPSASHYTLRRNLLIAGASLALLSSALMSRAQSAPQRSGRISRLTPREKYVGNLQRVATFYGAMPTGVTVSHSGRIFVNYPRWGDKVRFSVAEIRNGREVPFPNRAINSFGDDGNRAPLSQEKSDVAARLRARSLVGVQSVVVDPRDRLWILDTGSVKFGPVAYGGPKLVGVDLRTNRVFKTILFPQNVALKTTYLNDIRFDLRRGRDGVAFITDSSGTGPNGIIVVDLATGQSFRRLNDHPSVKAVPKFVPFVEGQAIMQRPKGQKPKYLTLGSDGIAISNDGNRLYYCPLASRRLYSVSTSALLNGKESDAAVAATVIDHGDKGMSDGLESDAQGRIYCTSPEQNAIVRRDASGMYETLVHDPRVLWPDTMSLATNGYLYFTANQLHRGPDYHDGQDLRVKPYSLFRVRVDASPVLLR